MRLSLALISLLIVSCGTPENIVPESPKERKMFAFLEKFDRFDYDGNGKLTKKEVRQGLKESDVPGVTDQEIDRGFAEFDTNKDGAISFREAQGGLRRAVAERDDKSAP
jgi:Ca2+-binding EF-hand superfamily protein